MTLIFKNGFVGDITFSSEEEIFTKIPLALFWMGILVRNVELLQTLIFKNGLVGDMFKMGLVYGFAAGCVCAVLAERLVAESVDLAVKQQAVRDGGGWRWERFRICVVSDYQIGPATLKRDTLFWMSPA